MIKEERATLSLPWAITFADMALLLLCFFIMLTTMRSNTVSGVAHPVPAVQSSADLAAAEL